MKKFLNHLFLSLLILLKLLFISIPLHAEEILLCIADDFGTRIDWGGKLLIKISKNDREVLLFKQEDWKHPVGDLKVKGSIKRDIEKITLLFNEKVEEVFKAKELESEISTFGDGSKLVMKIYKPLENDIDACKCNFQTKAEIKINRFDLNDIKVDFERSVAVKHLNPNKTSQEVIKKYTEEERLVMSKNLEGSSKFLGVEFNIKDIPLTYKSPSAFDICERECLYSKSDKSTGYYNCKIRVF